MTEPQNSKTLPAAVQSNWFPSHLTLTISKLKWETVVTIRVLEMLRSYVQTCIQFSVPLDIFFLYIFFQRRYLLLDLRVSTWSNICFLTACLSCLIVFTLIILYYLYLWTFLFFLILFSWPENKCFYKGTKSITSIYISL